MLTPLAVGSLAHRLARTCMAGVVAGVATVASLPSPADAQSFFEVARDFVVEKPCEAYRSLKRSAGPTPLEVGRSYPGRGLNRPNDPTHAFVRIGDESKWVALSCGRFVDGAPAVATPSTRRTAQPQQCLAFFDETDNPEEIGFNRQRPPERIDMSPPPPPASSFDNAITALCGLPGRVVTPSEFEAMVSVHPEVIERVRVFTGGKVFPGRPAAADANAFRADLTQAWFGNEAFNHIMCGEPSASGRGKIGGLHFRSRYLQLQQSGHLCRMSNQQQNEATAGVLYTMGVIMRMPDGREVRDARKGYGLTLDGEELLKLVTRAFAENPSTDGDKSACLLAVSDEGKSFTSVFVSRPAGIVTFYPDATPSSKDPSCKSPVALN